MAKIAELLKKTIISPAKKLSDSFWLYYHNGSVYRKVFLAAFGLFLLADLFTVLWGMPNFASWSPDDQSGPFIIGFVKFGAYKYAAFGSIINLIFYLPVLAIYFLTGTWDVSNPKYPDFGFSQPHWQLGALIVISRLLSFVFYLGAGYFLYLALKRFGRRLAVSAAALYMLAPIVVEFSTYGNLEAPIMFFTSVCFWALAEIYFSIAGEGPLRGKSWLTFFLFLAAIGSTKEPNAFTFLIPFVFLIFYKGYLSRGGWKKITSEVLPGILLFFISFALFTGLFWDWSGYVKHIQRWLGPTAVTHDYQQLGFVGVSLRTLEALALGSPLVLLLAAIGIFLIFWKKINRGFFIFSCLFSLSFFLFSLLSVGLVYLRYVIVIMFFLSLPAALALSWLWEKIKPSWQKIVVLVLAAALFCPALVPVLGKFKDSRYEAERFILNSVQGKNVQVLSNRYHTYLPRMEKMAQSKDWTAASVVFNSQLSPVPDRDLYIVEYEKFERYRSALANDYGILYDSGPRYPYYHRLDPGLAPCRISCRVLVLERKDTGAIVKPIGEEIIKGYYDTEKPKDEYDQ